MKRMSKVRKYVIIILIVVIMSILQNFNVFAAPETLGPGDDIPENSNWRVSTNEYLGSGGNEFWASWAPIHFGVGIDARLKPGDTSGSNIIYVDRTEGRAEGSEAVKGYGLYQFILEKHMVGYLYYLRNKVNDIENTGIIKTPGILPIFNEYYKAREACEYVANQLMSSAYSVANQNLLHTLLRDIANQNSADDIKKWQSDFWYNVFGNSAFTFLNGMGASNIISGHEKETRGAILSIMSDRYRNKSLNNKTNLRLNVEAGDLWPFLVYTTTNDNGTTTSWEYDKDGDSKTPNVPTTWDDLIKGAYYYMVYYEYKYDYEGDVELDEDVIYNSTKADMYVREYEELTGKRFVELEGKALDDFYQKIRTVRRIYKKSTDNGALFGEEEDYSINSDITYTRAMNNIKLKMEQEPFKEIFSKTLDTEHVARTYLMAKNIAENNRLTNQNAQYDIGSNILQRTPGGNDNTILLTDLQKIKLNRTDNGTYPDDADKDGILDGNEMGTYEQHDITKFVEHLLKAESGLYDVTTLMQNYKNNIIEANSSIIGNKKRNIVESQKDIDVVDGRIKVMLMSYKSNPIMKDTDFDGIDDGFGYEDRECTIFKNKNVTKDEKPKDNSIGGQITMAKGNEFSVNTHMDYRYFFLDEYNYYDELAEMSLLLSQSIYNRNDINLTNLNSLNAKIDAKLISRYVEADDDEKRSLNNYDYKTNYAIGHKYVEYSKDNSANNYIKKVVIPIAIPGMTSISDARSYSDKLL